MPLTRDQMADVKVIIKETITELLQDDTFIARISESVGKNLRIKETVEEVRELKNDIETLRNQNIKLQGVVCELQQHLKRKSLRVYGLKEKYNENIKEEMVSMFRNKLNINVNDTIFESCFRIGKNKNLNRPVLMTITRPSIKTEILAHRKLLKGSGITITEDLTRENYTLLKAATEKFGKENVWHFGGQVKVKMGEIKYIIKDNHDIQKLMK